MESLNLPNWAVILILFGCAFVVIQTSEIMNKRGVAIDLSRKVAHVMTGMVFVLTPFLTNNVWPGLIVFGLFVIINFIIWYTGSFEGMSDENESNLGGVWFALAAVVCAYFLWDYPPLMIAAFMPLTWGDAAASVIGRRLGRNKYAVFGNTRSYEGSAALFVFAFIAVLLALFLVPGQPILALGAALGAAGILALGSMLLESVSVWGLDNLFITAFSIIVMLQYVPA